MAVSSAASLPFIRADAFCLAGILAWTALVLCVTTGGYNFGDDIYYLDGVDGWLHGAPFVGTLHWHMRHFLILALSISITLLGRTEAALMAPGIVSLVVVVLVLYVMVRRFADRTAATVASLLAAATPVLAIYAKIAYPDMVEVMLTLLSFWLFWRARRKDAVSLLLAGLLLGLCFTMRASCAALVLLYGGLSLTGFRIGRLSYGWLWLGAALPLAAELSYFAIMTGNPFYRLGIDAVALEIPSSHLIGQVAGGLRPPFNWHLMARWLPNSYIDVHWALNPIIDLLTNLQHGFLVLIALLAARPLLRRFPARTEQGQLLRTLGLWALLTLFVVLVVLNLRPQPRYFATLTAICAVFAALWLADLIHRRRLLGVGLVASILAIDLLSAVARPDPIGTERWLVRYIQSNDGLIWTNKVHAEKAEFLLAENGLSGRVQIAGPEGPPSKALFFTTRQELRSSRLVDASVVWQRSLADDAAPLVQDFPASLGAIALPVLEKISPSVVVVAVK